MLPAIPQFKNVKCVPQDENWPYDKEMQTANFGGFYPNEVKRVQEGANLRNLLRSGEFEVTEEDPNSEDLRQAIADEKVRPDDDDLDEEETDEEEEQ